MAELIVIHLQAILFILLGLSKTENVTGESRASPEIQFSLYVVIDVDFKQKGLFSPSLPFFSVVLLRLLVWFCDLINCYNVNFSIVYILVSKL